jgi:hypothetical protein
MAEGALLLYSNSFNFPVNVLQSVNRIVRGSTYTCSALRRTLSRDQIWGSEGIESSSIVSNSTCSMK